MSRVRIVTWNINSVRLRIERLRQLVETLSPDIVCLQETKVQDDIFPHDAVAAMGFEHRVIRGQKNYNGVAILANRPVHVVDGPDWCGRGDSRHVAARIGDGGVEVHCFYVPSGGDAPDPAVNDKFAHKLDFLREMATHFQAVDPAVPRVLVGDLNVAPLETDVWSHKQLLTVVSHTPVEVEHLDRVQASLGWVDAVRHVHGIEDKLYSWWSYRARDWAASDRGRRLDHVWLSPDLVPSLADAGILRDARGWEKASDHVPVWADLEA